MAKDNTPLRDYAYNAMNRLEKAWSHTPDGGIQTEAAYRYNGLGQRTGKTLYTGGADRKTGDVREDYLLDLTRPYHNLLSVTRNDGTPVQTFYWDNNAAAMEETGELHYYLQDEMGSPIRVSGCGTGDGYLTYGYDEFGNDLAESTGRELEEAGIPNPYTIQGEGQPFGYTGYRYDTVSGTYFAQAREYQPGTGRFCAQDVIAGNGAAPETLNRYGYCLGNPVGLVDLDGLTPMEKTINYYARENGMEENELELYIGLSTAVCEYANDGQMLKTAPFNNTYEAMEIVLSYDDVISDAAVTYGVEKEMIQAVLFQEVRFYGIDDPIADSLVVQSFAYDSQMEKYINGEIYIAPEPVLGYRTDSSTGLGQIFASTAIAAYAWLSVDGEISSEKIELPKQGTEERYEMEKEMWYMLQDSNYNINTIAVVLLHKQHLLGENATVRETMRAYNGSEKSVWAQKYGDVTLEYYELFKQYNQTKECG